MTHPTLYGAAHEGIRALLLHLGQDPHREGIRDTPARVVKAFEEMTSGYKEDPAKILSTRFTADYDQMVIVNGIDFTSLCEHHLLPFVGTASVAYIPRSTVVGLSKIPRLVHCFAKRLQLQEQMTTQIAAAMQSHLQPQGVGVVVRASHQCMSCRGVKQAGATMVTSALLGEFQKAEVRAEFLRLGGM